MPEAKGDPHSMKKIQPKQPDTQVTPPAQPTEAVRQTGEEKPVAANSAAALRARLLGTLAITKQVVAGAHERQEARQRAEEERQRQEERERKMGEFGDLKTQKRAAEERLQPILRAHEEARVTLEAAKAELQEKNALLIELQSQMKDIIPPEGILDEDASAAMATLEETVGVLQSAIEHDEGTVVPSAQQQVDAVYAERVEAEKDLAQIDQNLKASVFEGLGAEYDEAFQQYQALEAKTEDLAGKYEELDRKLRAFAKEALSTARTPNGHQKTSEFNERFQQLQEEAEALLISVVEAGIILDTDQTAKLHPVLMAARLVCKNFKIGITDGQKDAFQAAEGLLSQINKGEETSVKANEALFELQVEAFKREHGVEARGMYPKNLFRLERLRGTKPTGKILGYGFSSVKAGKEEIADEDLLLAPGVSIKEVNGKNVNFISVREEQEKRTKRRTTEDRGPRKPGTKPAERKEAPQAGIPGILAKLRSSVKPGEESPTKLLKSRVDAFLADAGNTEEVTVKQGDKAVQVRVPAQGIYRVFAMDGKTKVAIGVVRFKLSDSGARLEATKVSTLVGFETAFRNYVKGISADLLVDLHEEAVKTETAKLNPKPKAEGGEADSAAAETVEEPAPAEPGSLRAMHRALMVPVREGQETLAEKISKKCDERITGDIAMEKTVKGEGESTKEVRKFSCPGWFAIMKDSLSLGVAKLEEKGGKFTVSEVVTEPEYQQAVTTLVQGMIQKGKIQTAGAKTPLQEGLIPVGQNKLRDLFVEPGSLKAMSIAFKKDQKILEEKIAKICDKRIAGDIKEDPVAHKYSCPGWFAIMKDSLSLGVAKVEEKDGKFTVSEVVTEPEYQQAVTALAQGMIKRGEIQTAGAEKPLAKGLIPVGQRRLGKLFAAAHQAEKKPE